MGDHHPHPGGGVEYIHPEDILDDYCAQRLICVLLKFKQSVNRHVGITTNQT